MPYPTLFVTPGVKAFAEAVDTERQAQLRKWGEQHHPDGTGRPGDREEADRLRAACKANGPVEDNWRDILAEEIAEAFAESDPEKLRTELIQSAAVIAAWLADLDSRTTGGECPAGLMPLDGGDVERCTVKGRHVAHLTEDGQSWTDGTGAGAR